MQLMCFCLFTQVPFDSIIGLLCTSAKMIRFFQLCLLGLLLPHSRSEREPIRNRALSWFDQLSTKAPKIGGFGVKGHFHFCYDTYQTWKKATCVWQWCNFTYFDEHSIFINMQVGIWLHEKLVVCIFLMVGKSIHLLKIWPAHNTQI